MKSRKRPGFFLLKLFLGFTLLSMIGCASTGANLRTENEYQASPERGVTRPNINRAPDHRQPAQAHESPSELSVTELERLGDLHFKQANLHMAYVQYEKALKLDLGNPRLLYKEGLLFLAAGSNEDAIKQFETILKKDSSFALAYEGMGNALFGMKKYDDAEMHLQKAIGLNPKLWMAHNLLGMICDLKGNYSTAIQKYATAISENPNEGFLYHNLGVSYSLAGEYEEAIRAFNVALEKNHNKKRTYNNLGLALCKVGRYQEALDAFAKGGSQAQAHNNLGCVFLSAGDVQKAIYHFEKAIETSPTFYARASENLKKARMAAVN